MLSKLKRIFRRYLTVKVVSAARVPVFNGSLLTGKVALVVGASGGIGSAIARSFVANGCKVVATGTNRQKLDALRAELGEDRVASLITDVKDVSGFDAAIASSASLFGPLDVLAYCSGAHSGKPFGSVDERTWDSIIDVNLKGMYFMCQSFAAYLIANKRRGHILTVGSASCAKPGWTPYEISKNGVRALTLGLADKLIEHGIVVNGIAPGPVATPMLGKANADDLAWPGNPTGRMCAPEEIANWATFLVSDMGDMVVGDSFFVSGGSGTICLDK